MSEASQNSEQDPDVNEQTAASLGDAAARPSIWELALPSILGNLSYTIVGMVQTKFVGELGPQALAAVGAGQRVMFAMLAVLMAVSAGTTALVARAWGAETIKRQSRHHGILGAGRWSGCRSGDFGFPICRLSGRRIWP